MANEDFRNVHSHNNRWTFSYLSEAFLDLLRRYSKLRSKRKVLCYRKKERLRPQRITSFEKICSKTKFGGYSQAELKRVCKKGRTDNIYFQPLKTQLAISQAVDLLRPRRLQRKQYSSML